MVLPTANGTHPDGDPFAAADALRARNTPLGRLEARALEEQRRLEAGLSPAPAPPPVSAVVAPPVRSQRRTPSLYGTPRREENVPIVVIDDSNDEASQGKQATSGDATASGSATSAPPQSSATNGGAPPKEHGEEDKPSSAADEAPVANGSKKDDSGDAIMQDVSASSSTLAPIARTANGRLPSPLSQGPASSLSSVAPTPAPGSPTTPLTTTTAPAPVPAPAPAPRVRQRSPSPPPPPKPAPPPRTVRLALVIPSTATITEVPEYSVAGLAREAGYGIEESEKEKEGSGSGSDSGSESDGGTKTNGKGKEKEKDDKMEGVEETGDKAAPAIPTKRKRAPAAILGRLGGYDVEDPFVDDSEIALYEPQWYHRPKRDGFFVCTGLLELIGDAKSRGRTLGSKNKPKYDKDGKLIPARRKSNKLPEGSAVASTSTSTPAGTKAKPASKKDAAKPAAIVIDDDDDVPSVSSVPAFGAGAQAPLMSPPPKKKKAGGVVSDALQSEFDRLKVEIAKESFEVKNKFPPRLRPLLADVALLAVELGEYDDDFFAALPKLLPYNLFTLKKLVKREIFPRRIELFNEAQEDHLDTIRAGIAETLPGQLAEYEQLKKEWEEDQKGKDQEASEERKRMEVESMKQDQEGDTPERGAGAPMDVDGAASPAPKKGAVAGSPKPGTSPGGGEAKVEEHEVPEPKWKFRFSEAMRLAVYGVYTIEDEKSELIVEKQTLEKSTEKDGPGREKPYSALAAKKALYAKLAALWPDDLMTTNQLSREMSMTKKKVDREKERALPGGAA